LINPALISEADAKPSAFEKCKEETWMTLKAEMMMLMIATNTKQYITNNTE
jgi:hypothetical protein